MNLLDAMSSGRPFKCPSSTTEFGRYWRRASAERGFEAIDCIDFKPDSRLTVTEILSEWVVKEASVTITENQFWDAANEAWRECGYMTLSFPPGALKVLARKLKLQQEF